MQVFNHCLLNAVFIQGLPISKHYPWSMLLTFLDVCLEEFAHINMLPGSINVVGCMSHLFLMVTRKSDRNKFHFQSFAFAWNSLALLITCTNHLCYIYLIMFQFIISQMKNIFSVILNWNWKMSVRNEWLDHLRLSTDKWGWWAVCQSLFQ